MKNFVFWVTIAGCCLVVVVFCLVCRVGVPEQGQTGQLVSKEELAASAKDQRLQQMADTVIAQTHYAKDPRTGICFAYTWGGDLQGTQSLTQVPEDKIPPELLKTAIIIGK